MTNEDLAKRYESEMGKPPKELPETHPYRWQWDYRGSKAEREDLASLIGLEEEPPPVIEGQEELFP